MTDASLSFHPLSFLPDRKDAGVVVGRRDSESFAILDADDAALLERMVSGMPPDQAAAWYESEFGLAVDMPDFLESLDELGFLRRSEDPVVDLRPPGLEWLGRALFSRLAFVVLGVAVAAYLLAIRADPGIAPNPRQVFFTNSLVLVQLLVVFGQLPWIGLHEACHVLAGRRIGLRSQLGMGIRLYFVVFETRMNGLLTVRHQKRYLPMLAGLLMDAFVISSLGLIAFAVRNPDGSDPLIGRIALAMAFPILVRFAYQFLLFLQTDIYFVVATAIGTYDLHAAAQALIRNRVWKLLGRPDKLIDEDQWTARDLRAARGYAPFYLVGAGVLIAIGVLVIVPILLHIGHLAVTALNSSPLHVRFWDTLAFIALNLAQFGLLGFVATPQAHADPPRRAANRVPKGLKS